MSSGLLTNLRFCEELVEANKLRDQRGAWRKNERLTEEGDLTAELVTYGVLMRLFRPGKNEYTAEQLRKRFNPGGGADNRNWRRKLDECAVPYVKCKPWGNTKVRVA
jgi:hypothetical protein